MVTGGMVLNDNGEVTQEKDPLAAARARFARIRPVAATLEALAQAKTRRDSLEQQRQDTKFAFLRHLLKEMPDLESLTQTAANPVSDDLLRFGIDLSDVSEADRSDVFIELIIKSIHSRMENFQIPIRLSNYLQDRLPEVVLMMNGRYGEEQHIRAMGEKTACHALSVLHYYISLGEYLIKNPAWEPIVNSPMFWELAIAALDHDLLEDGSGATIIRTESLEESTPYQLIWRSEPLDDTELMQATRLLKAYGKLTQSFHDGEATLSFIPTQRKGTNPLLFADIVPHEVQAALSGLFGRLVLVSSDKDERGRVVFKVQKNRFESPRLTRTSMAGIVALTNFKWQRDEGEAKVVERWGVDWINRLGKKTKNAVLGAMGKSTAQSDTVHDVVRKMNPDQDPELLGLVLIHFIKLMDIFHNLKTLPGMVKRKGLPGARQYLLEEIAKARALEHQLMYEIRRVCKEDPERYMRYMDTDLMQVVSKFGILIECHDGLDWYVEALKENQAQTRVPGRRGRSPQPESVQDIITIINHLVSSLEMTPVPHDKTPHSCYTIPMIL